MRVGRAGGRVLLALGEGAWSAVGLGIALAPRTAVANNHPDVRVISLGQTAPCARRNTPLQPNAIYRPDWDDGGSALSVPRDRS